MMMTLLVQTQQKLLYIWLNRARYWMRELEDTPEFRKLSVTEDFQITVGTYRDWQELIFRLRTDVDLLDAQDGLLINHLQLVNKEGCRVHLRIRRVPQNQQSNDESGHNANKPLRCRRPALRNGRKRQTRTVYLQ